MGSMFDTYAFPVSRGAKVQHPKAFVEKPEPEPVWEIKPVQGITPDSKEEYFSALVFYKYGIEFSYQVDIDGGRDRAQGNILDFLLYTMPLWQPVDIRGAHWHGGEKQYNDDFRIGKIDDHFRGRAKLTLIVDAADIDTPERALLYYRSKLL